MAIAGHGMDGLAGCVWTDGANPRGGVSHEWQAGSGWPPPSPSHADAARLRPNASDAADAILVGDPGRALLLAQELLEQPKMSNHARGLWGYSGQTPAGTS